MKCSGSPTTSSVPDAAALAPGASAPGAASSSESAAEEQAFEAVLASSLMKPLAEQLGPVGGFVTEAIARAALDHARAEGLT